MSPWGWTRRTSRRPGTPGTWVSPGWGCTGTSWAGPAPPALEEQVRGYVAYVWPDPKSTRLEEGKGLRFVLPSVIEENQ